MGCVWRGSFLDLLVRSLKSIIYLLTNKILNITHCLKTIIREGGGGAIIGGSVTGYRSYGGTLKITV